MPHQNPRPSETHNLLLQKNTVMEYMHKTSNNPATQGDQLSTKARVSSPTQLLWRNDYVRRRGVWYVRIRKKALPWTIKMNFLKAFFICMVNQSNDTKVEQVVQVEQVVLIIHHYFIQQVCKVYFNGSDYILCQMKQIINQF